MDISDLCSELHRNLYCCYILEFRNNVKTQKFTSRKGLVVESMLFNDDISTIDDILFELLSLSCDIRNLCLRSDLRFCQDIVYIFLISPTLAVCRADYYH